MDVDDFKKSFEKLKKLSLDGSMKLIKRDLKNLGIIHDNFISENDLVKKLITKVIKKLEKAKYLSGLFTTPKG